SLSETADKRGLGTNLHENENSQREFASTLGTKVEIKNINSFRFAKDAIDYEIKRQREVLEKGEKIVQETRGWDEKKRKTVSQRSKEEAHDYRYFPEPDLPPIYTSVFDLEELKISLPELPKEKRARFMKEFGLDGKQTEALVSDMALAEFFEESVSELKTLYPKPETPAPTQTLFNYLTSDFRGLLNEAGVSVEDSKINPERLAHLVSLIEGGKIMSRQAKDILKKMFETGLDPEEILDQEGLHTVSDEGELAKVVEEIIAENSAAVADYKKGKTASMQFLIGKAMGKLKGRGSPDTLREIFERAINAL
ncbi:MAG: Asp-tRNA(Asn)/Glu-tRNA(Gln) amidotransferase subunit GatB, partial [Patescibacteria group bacterium]